MLQNTATYGTCMISYTFTTAQDVPVNDDVTRTYRSSSFPIIFLSLSPCEFRHDGFESVSADECANAPSSHAALMLKSTLWRHLATANGIDNID